MDCPHASRTTPLHNNPQELAALVAYQNGGIASTTLIDTDTCTVTLFACDAQTRISEHSAPFDALVYVIEGTGTYTVGDTTHTVPAGSALVMPADIPHSVAAAEKFKMLLIMARTEKESECTSCTAQN